MSGENAPSFLRHSGYIATEDLQDNVIIIGCGAVGSNVAVLLARMGVTNFTLFDSDKVEAHNLPNQAFDVCHLGKPKVEALKDVLLRFNPQIKVTANNSFFTEETEIDIAGPVILATDSFSSRGMIMGILADDFGVDHMYEVRLGFDFGIVNIVDVMDEDQVANWMATIRSDDDPDIAEPPCNQKICGTLVYAVCAHLVHCLCARARAARNETEWEFSPKVMFTMSDKGLRTFCESDYITEEPAEDTAEEAIPAADAASS